MQKTGRSRRPNPYAVVLRTPGAARFSAAAVLARLPMSMLGIGTILLVEAVYESYALAGRVSATLIVAQAVVSPQVARLVDRIGQRRTTLPLVFTAAVGLGGLITTGVTHGPEPLLYVFAILAGASSVSYGSMVRARWSHALSDPKLVHTAYSLESALDEAVFVVGPAVVTLLATTVTPSAGLLVPLVAAVVGGLWFVSQRATEPPVVVHEPGTRHRTAMREPGMLVLVLAFVGMGVVFGATDVSTIAFTDEKGAPGLAGLLLATFAFGSLLSGLFYGARHWVMALWKRFVIGMLLLGAGASLFFLVDSTGVLAAVMFVTGFAIAPTLINGNALVQSLVRPAQLTEGLTWVSTALGLGVSVGASLAGSRVDAVGAHGGFEVVMGGAALAVVVTLLAVRSLRRDRSREEITTTTA
nr:MFS transporter [Sediminihabitans luteus]